MDCPKHGPMQPMRTKFGRQWRCMVSGCTVACWDGPTSTPADDETRALRKLCHQAFDPLWQPGARFPGRNAAYRWLREFMSLSKHETHIGMFDAEQCRKLLAEIAPEVVA